MDSDDMLYKYMMLLLQLQRCTCFNILKSGPLLELR